MGAKPAEAIEAGPEIIRGTAGSQDLSDRIVQTLYQEAELIAGKVVSKKAAGVDWDRRLDDILTSRLWGYPLMLLLLGLIFWITISGANYPSELLTRAFFGLERYLGQALLWLGLPDWLYGFLLLGVYRSLAWVVAVMLPPMAIFFPLFTILEDLGYLPRLAYNIYNFFYRAGACGKQALTMCMGFGCNAAGVISCRIIESPRERLIAVLTNNFVPCNGRFPLLITVAVIISGGMVLKAGSITAAAAVLASVLIGVCHPYGFLFSFPDLPSGNALILYPGNAALPETSPGPDHCQVHNGPHFVRLVPGSDRGGPGGGIDLDPGQYQLWGHQSLWLSGRYFGSIRAFPGYGWDHSDGFYPGPAGQ